MEVVDENDLFCTDDDGPSRVDDEEVSDELELEYGSEPEIVDNAGVW